MSSYRQAINAHYGQDDLTDKILAALSAAGKDINALTRDDLSAFDQMHVGGIIETRNLAQLAGLKPGMSILDIGSGLGGPARTLAAEFGCTVTGLDLTEALCDAAAMLTARVGLSDRVVFQHGDALDMPFEDSSFDVVWTQFTGMNISDKERMYSEVHRVLKASGRFAFYEVMAGSQGEPDYPLFWAAEPSVNFLRSPAEIRILLKTLGFTALAWNDISQHVLDLTQRIVDRLEQKGVPRFPYILFDPDTVLLKTRNYLRSAFDHRVSVIQAVLELGV